MFNIVGHFASIVTIRKKTERHVKLDLNRMLHLECSGVLHGEQVNGSWPPRRRTCTKFSFRFFKGDQILNKEISGILSYLGFFVLPKTEQSIFPRSKSLKTKTAISRNSATVLLLLLKFLHTSWITFIPCMAHQCTGSPNSK